MRELHIFHDPNACPEEWRLEEIDSDRDGGCDVVIFTGPPHAEQRARRFLDRLQNHIDSHRPAEARAQAAQEAGADRGDRHARQGQARPPRRVIRLHEQQQANDKAEEQPRRSAIVTPKQKPSVIFGAVPG